MRLKFILPAIALALFASCNNKPKTETVDPELIEFEQEKEQKSQIIKLGDYSISEDAQGEGHNYHYSITRQSLDSLGVVTNEDGYQAYDNKLSISVTRDGGLLYSSNLTRAQFRPYMSAEDYNQYILMNAVFDRIAGSDVCFIVSLGDAADGGELFVQFALTVHADGTSSIAPREMYDEDEIDRVN